MSVKMTVREIVQSVLAAMDSDPVDSIGDTIESEQIALTVKETYYEIATYQDVPQFRKLVQLIGLADTDRRTIMALPENVTDIMNVRYLREKNGREIMEPCHYVDPDKFFDQQWSLNTSDTTVDFNTLADNIRIPYRNDRSPTCWTSFDDQHVVFDSIDRAVDDTLHNDSSICLGRVVPIFLLEDDYTPELPEKMFPQYLQQVKEIAFLEKKQTVNPIQREKRQRSEHRNRHLVAINDGLDNGQARPTNYGRRSRSFRRS